MAHFNLLRTVWRKSYQHWQLVFLNFICLLRINLKGRNEIKKTRTSSFSGKKRKKSTLEFLNWWLRLQLKKKRRLKRKPVKPRKRRKNRKNPSHRQWIKLECRKLCIISVSNRYLTYVLGLGTVAVKLLQTHILFLKTPSSTWHTLYFLMSLTMGYYYHHQINIDSQ